MACWPWRSFYVPTGLDEKASVVTGIFESANRRSDDDIKKEATMSKVPYVEGYTGSAESAEKVRLYEGSGICKKLKEIWGPQFDVEEVNSNSEKDTPETVSRAGKFSISLSLTAYPSIAETFRRGESSLATTGQARKCPAALSNATRSTAVRLVSASIRSLLST